MIVHDSDCICHFRVRLRMTKSVKTASLQQTCWRRALPCYQPGVREVGGDKCDAYYRCATDGSNEYLIRWRCTGGAGIGADLGNTTMCAQPNPDKNCAPPIVCPSSQWQTASVNPQSTFPTEIVIGGTLGTLSLIAIIFIIIAAIRKWQIKRRQRYRHPHHRPIKKTRLVPWFGDPMLAYDISVRDKVYRAYDNYATDVYFPAAHSTPRATRIHGYHENSSDNALCGVGDESHYEPSIIAGSFVYHPPTNLPPHLIPDYNQNLSYDSFKNEHLYENNTRGVVSSTLNNHHQPPDFYL